MPVFGCAIDLRFLRSDASVPFFIRPLVPPRNESKLSTDPTWLSSPGNKRRFWRRVSIETCMDGAFSHSGFRGSLTSGFHAFSTLSGT